MFSQYYIFGLFVFFVIILVMSFCYSFLIRKQNKRIRSSILQGKFIHASVFEKNWISAKHKNKGIAGYKYNDTSGCYVILFFDQLVTDNNFRDFENIYIGQSVKICQRVHNHFTGKGKGDVYADIKYGKQAYVQFVPCPKSDMNKVEKELIKIFNAQKSYNNTRGGGAIRYN